VPLPTSLGSLGIFLAVVAPGLLFELGLARRLTYLRRPLVDRALQLVAWSLLIGAMLLPLSAYVVRNVPDDIGRWDGGDWWLAWWAGLVVTLGSFVAGELVARSTGRVKAWVLGSDPAPLAWHKMWETMAAAEHAYVRERLRESGTWIAGRLRYSSDEPGDLLLAPRLQCDPQTGELLLDGEGQLEPIDWQSWISCDDIDRLEAQAHT
jgi:hypothetical protein